jgi:branched-subunit amino acid aminotransferase/4-amino-4-deoxychorismate lyase
VSEYVEVDGRPASAEQLKAAALDGYGHFTAMQVRDKRVRGLDLHLTRLDSANREMFGSGVDAEIVRRYIGHALGEVRDGSVRVYVRQPRDLPSLMVTVRPPAAMAAPPWRLMSVPYQRSVAHIKHLGDFGQRFYGRLAERAGFDEALLTGPGGVISEGSITNVGFFDGDTVIWPEAPCLAGITMQLVEAAFAGHGIRSSRREVRLADVAGFSGVFVTNARGIAPVGQVDDVLADVDAAMMKALTAAFESASWDVI